MKILVVSNLYPPDMIGGYELGCRQAVEALRERGHEVRVLTSAFRRHTPSDPMVRRRLRVVDVWSDALFQARLPVNSHLLQAESHRTSAANVHALLDEIHDFQPDVVYLWMLVGIGGLGLITAVQDQGIPWVWHLMDDVPRILCSGGDSVLPAFQRGFETLLTGDYLACSRQLADELESQGFHLDDRVTIVPNWVDDAAEVGPIRDHDRDRSQPGSPLRIVTAAGLVDRRGDKGLDLLVESASLLLQQGHDGFCMDIFGRIADDTIPDLIRERGVGSHVRLLGPRTQAEWICDSADYDLFAFPTRAREPFGFAALEAAGRGCVPVISRVCGIAEWLVHGIHCLKAARRPEAFARVFREAMSGSIDLNGLSRRAQSAVRRDFHVRAVAPLIEQALARAASRRQPPSRPADETYRLALLAERLTQVLWQEPLSA
jgi:glycosyltransferase involved in cell wall biosynthesis